MASKYVRKRLKFCLIFSTSFVRLCTILISLYSNQHIEQTPAFKIIQILHPHVLYHRHFPANLQIKSNIFENLFNYPFRLYLLFHFHVDFFINKWINFSARNFSPFVERIQGKKSYFNNPFQIKPIEILLIFWWKRIFFEKGKRSSTSLLSFQNMQRGI